MAVSLAVCAMVAPKIPTESTTTKLARDFLETLSAEQRAKTVFAASDPERTNWKYVPADRRGLSWGEMNASQTQAATELLKNALSQEGYKKVDKIRGLEMVLREIENGNPGRDPSRYWFVFFGEPSDDSSWVWRYEGHHISLTFGLRDGAMISSTPQFLGSNPAEVKSGRQKGERVLALEQDLGFHLIESLTKEQLAKAVLSSEAPTDIVSATKRNAAIENHLGLGYSELTQAQKKSLRDLINSHASVQTKSEQKRRAAAIQKEGFDHIVFAWLGPVSRNARHYYRIQGESFLIEFDNTQADGNHIHAVWRDFKGDFGEDALAEHYAEDHQHH